MSKKEINENIIVTSLEDIFGDRFGRYSKYIIQDRALPDVRDGLKPVQRRILYTMNYDGNTHEKAYRKSAKSVGLIMGNFHPHGDSSIYDAMVRMSQDWKSRIPLIDMHGNNGSMDDDPAAAMRYTEARLSPLSKYLLMDIEKDTVNWAPNFDDTEEEPTVLPARYPNLLVSGITGIAAGYATNIPPHNLSEVIEGTILRIKNPTCKLNDIMKVIKGPDFPTGGIVQGKEGIESAFTSGKGRVVVRAKSEIIQTKTIQQIIVTEIPYEVVKCNLVKKIDDIRLDKKIDGIIDVRDESDRNGLKIVIDIKKDNDANLILNYLLKNTDLQIYYNYNSVAIVNKRPMQLGILAMLDAFIAHREVVITRRSVFELKRKEKRCHILEGLIKCISVLDEVISIIRSSNDKADSKIRLINRFNFTEEQAEAIVILRLYRLSNTDVLSLKTELETLLKEIEQLNLILNNNEVLKNLMIEELKQVNDEFGVSRISQIEDDVEEIVIDKIAMIPNEQVMLTVSNDGYVKKVSLKSYAASDKSITGIKEGDQLIGYREVSTLDYLVFVTSRGTYGYVHVYDIEYSKWKDVGTHINSIVKMGSDEKIINCFVLKDLNIQNLIVTSTKYGMIKTTKVCDLLVSRNNKTMSLMNVSKGDELVSCKLSNAHNDVLIITRNGYITKYSLDLVATTAPKSKGVIGIKLVDDVVVDTCIYDYTIKSLVVLCENGLTKRLKISDIENTKRSVKGNLIAKIVKSKPNYIKYAIVDELNANFEIFDSEIKNIGIKDITLMNSDSTFSNSNNISAGYYLIKNINSIDELDIIQNNIEEIEEEIFIDDIQQCFDF